MAVIKSGATTDQLVVDPLSKAARASLYDTSGNPIASANPLPVILSSAGGGSSLVSVTNFPPTQPVSAATLPLPAGAATLTAQGTANTSLASIDSKTPPLGQSLMASSYPVVLASNQSALPVSGTVALSGTIPISAATLPLPTGAAADATLASLSAKVPSLGQKAMAAATPVVIASDQSPFAVSINNLPTTMAVTGTVSVSNLPATQPVSAAALPLPVGAATSAAQVTGNASLASVDSKTPAVGQVNMAGSSPVVLASNHTTIAVAGSVTVSNFPATQPISGVVTSNAGTPVQDPSTTGTLTAPNQAVTLMLPGATSTWAVGLGGVFSAGSSIVFEATVDNINWNAINGRQSGIVNTVINSVVTGGAAPYLYRGNNVADLATRVRCLAIQSGDNITVNLRASSGAGAVFLTSSLPTGTNTVGSVNQGQAGTTSWKVDGSAVTQPVSGTVSVTGVVATQSVSSSAAVLTNFAFGPANAVLVPANPARKGLVIYNASATAILWISEGAVATTTSGYPLAAGASLFFSGTGIFVGTINGICAVGSVGNAYVTERS